MVRPVVMLRVNLGRTRRWFKAAKFFGSVAAVAILAANHCIDRANAAVKAEVVR